MLSNIMEERKGLPFIIIRKNEPTQYPQYPYSTEYRIFYDYEEYLHTHTLKEGGEKDDWRRITKEQLKEEEE